MRSQRAYGGSCPHDPIWRDDWQYADYKSWYDTLDRVLCPFSCCTIELCPDCHRIVGGVGLVACPCDHIKGWNSKYVDGMGKPHPPVKAAGKKKDRCKKAEAKFKRHWRWVDSWSQRFKDEGGTATKGETFANADEFLDALDKESDATA